MSDQFSQSPEEAAKKFEALYITAQQIADAVGVSRASVFSARNSGRLPNGFNIGSTYIWERAFIKPYVDSWKDKMLQMRSGAQ